MPYGTIKVDNVTFTDGGLDRSITLSGLYASTSGNLTVTGTVSGNKASFASGNFTTITGSIATITSGIFSLGTDVTPSISFSGDSDTGIYSPGNNNVAVTTSGIERFRITNEGRFGLNTTNPLSKFHVAGDAHFGAFNTVTMPASSANGGMYVSWNRSSGSAETNIYNLYDNAGMSFEFLQKTGTSTANVLLQLGTTQNAFPSLGFIFGNKQVKVNTDNSFLLLQGGSTGGANIELNGPSSGSASNAVFDAAGHYFRSTDALTRYATLDDTGLAVGALSTADAQINIGKGATGNRYSYLDLIGDTTYTDYGLRIIRSNTGANTSSNIYHRGTGYLILNTLDGGSIALQTSSTTRIYIDGTTGHVSCPSGVSGSLTRSTEIPITPGALSASFTSLPTWVKRISIHLSGVSLSGTDHLLVRLSTGGTFAATGYLSGVNYTDGVAATVGTGTTSTAGYAIGLGNASNIQTGTYTFTNITGNTWIGTYVGTYDNDVRYVAYGAGKVTLGGILDGIRLLPTGSNTFDAGTVNITYEG